VANRTADATQVGRAMVNQMSDEQLVRFARTERGRVLFDKISNQVAEQNKADAQSGWFGNDETAINANKIAQQRIAKAKEQAISQLDKKSPNASEDSPIWAREGDLPRVLGDKEIPNGGNPNINVELPKSGIGFVIYNPIDSPYETNVIINGQKVKAGTIAKSDQVGTGETIQNVQDITREWFILHPESPLEIGDISLPSGANTKDHGGHQNGKIVDVRPIRTNDKWGKSQAEGGALTYRDKAIYDQEKTKEIITFILQKYPNAIIRFNDRELIKQLPPELKNRVIPDRKGTVHDNHFHVEF
jgi:hypothetical protein